MKVLVTNIRIDHRETTTFADDERQFIIGATTVDYTLYGRNLSEMPGTMVFKEDLSEWSLVAIIDRVWRSIKESLTDSWEVQK